MKSNQLTFFSEPRVPKIISLFYILEYAVWNFALPPFHPRLRVRNVKSIYSVEPKPQVALSLTPPEMTTQTLLDILANRQC